jgi:hypothetical protein
MSRKIFAEVERLELLKKFMERKISVPQFCEEHKVSRQTIYGWKKSRLKFIPLQVSPPLHDGIEAIKANEILAVNDIISPLKLYKSDFVIEFHSGCSRQEVKLVIELLNASK